jgi:hypothetical protein
VALKFHLNPQVCPTTVKYMNFQVAGFAAPEEMTIVATTCGSRSEPGRTGRGEGGGPSQDRADREPGTSHRIFRRSSPHLDEECRLTPERHVNTPGISRRGCRFQRARRRAGLPLPIASIAVGGVSDAAGKEG